MGIFSGNTEEKKYEATPEGKHNARLIWVIDVGTHEDTYEGTTKDKHSVYLCWELVDTKMEDGRPFVIGNYYTITNSHMGYGCYLSDKSSIYKALKTFAVNKKGEVLDAELNAAISKKYPSVNILAGLLAKNYACEIETFNKDVDGKLYPKIDSFKPVKDQASVRPAQNQSIGYEIGGPGIELIKRKDLVKKIECSKEMLGLLGESKPPEEDDIVF